MKKRKLIYILGFFLLGFMVTSNTACSKKVGCPVNENVNAKSGRKGKLSSKRGKSNLFPKGMRKKK